tara:strand:- start:9 stop:833 length:825 start_codon:yes stop_codon:yes gene_type:complete
MRQKHNKKRNTAFLYEALNRELTISILEKNAERRNTALSILKEFFKKDSILAKELSLYQNMIDVEDMSPPTANKLIQETRFLHATLDEKRVFNQQTKLINTINKKLSKDVFSYFVPNYKSLATVYQIFNAPVGSKERVLLEESLINSMVKKEVPQEEEPAPVDDLVYKTFVEKFNEQYNGKLAQEQKTLLEKYIFSFTDGGLEFKIFLNEEVSRLKNDLNEARKTKELTEDPEMSEKADRVLQMLEEYKTKEFTDSKELIGVLRVQELVREIND